MDCQTANCDEEAVSSWLFCHRPGHRKHGNGDRSGSLDNRHRSAGKDPSASSASVYESVHLGVKCYRALLNNQVR